MNLLSHAFFAREYNDDSIIIGASLPDLLALWNRACKISRLKEFLARAQGDLRSLAPQLIIGIDLHLSADRKFHAGEFFQHGQKAIRCRLQTIPALPVKRFFLAHILLEMLLDRFLIHHYPYFIDNYYQIFSPTICAQISKLVEECFAISSGQFQNFLDRFIASRFLYRYRDLDELVASAARVSARVSARRSLPSMDAAAQKMIAIHLADIEKDLQESMSDFFQKTFTDDEALI
jgi:acyl carrier protein phosphodiesterase